MEGLGEAQEARVQASATTHWREELDTLRGFCLPGLRRTCTCPRSAVLVNAACQAPCPFEPANALPTKDGPTPQWPNMHGQNGIEAKNMKVAFVLHGAAAKDALSNEAYKKQFGFSNPNTELITALKKANVAICVCGQSYKSRGFPVKGISKDVKLSLSALTALVEYQENGYKIINFN